MTQGKVAIVDDEDFERLNSFKWHYAGGYARRGFAVKGKWFFHYMHRYALNVDNIVDHINHDTLDNRKCNLRTVTGSQNHYNMKKWKLDASSKFKGVSWKKSKRRWTAYISVDKKQIGLGLFKEETDAAKAYNEAAARHYGDFALLNIITENG